MAGPFLPSPLLCVPSCWYRETACHMFRIFHKFFFPRIKSLASNWFPCNPSNTVKYAASFLRSICIMMPLFQALIWTLANTHAIHDDTLLLVVYINVKHLIGIMRYIAWSVLRYAKIMLDNDIDISRNYRMIHMPLILHTIPNTHVCRQPFFLVCECFLYHVRFLLFVSGNMAKYLT